MKKRILALALTVVMALSMAACGSKKPTLDELIKSEEMQSALDTMNSQVAASGITIDLVADGNTFVYEYQLPDDDIYNSLTKEDAATAFDPTIQAYAGSVEQIFTSFKSEYGIELDAVRFTFKTADGNELYSSEIKN